MHRKTPKLFENYTKVTTGESSQHETSDDSSTRLVDKLFFFSIAEN